MCRSDTRAVPESVPGDIRGKKTQENSHRIIGGPSTFNPPTPTCLQLLLLEDWDSCFTYCQWSFCGHWETHGQCAYTTGASDRRFSDWDICAHWFSHLLRGHQRPMWKSDLCITMNVSAQGQQQGAGQPVWCCTEPCIEHWPAGCNHCVMEALHLPIQPWTYCVGTAWRLIMCQCLRYRPNVAANVGSLQ